MSKIESLKATRARIKLSDCLIRVFVDYKNNYCVGIRVWKLPIKNNFWAMFNTKNLIWAIYGDDAMVVHGWFLSQPLTKESDKRENWFHVFIEDMAQNENFDDIKKFLINVEGVVNSEADAMIRLSGLDNE